MDLKTHKEIRSLMTNCGVWGYVTNLKIYTTEEFINEFGDVMPEELIKLLQQNVNRIQAYCDERILEPLNRV